MSIISSSETESQNGGKRFDISAQRLSFLLCIINSSISCEHCTPMVEYSVLIHVDEFDNGQSWWDAQFPFVNECWKIEHSLDSFGSIPSRVKRRLSVAPWIVQVSSRIKINSNRCFAFPSSPLFCLLVWASLSPKVRRSLFIASKNDPHEIMSNSVCFAI